MVKAGPKHTRQWIIYRNKMYDAKRKNIHFSLRFEDIVFPTHCPILGIELDYGKKKTIKMNSPSFERFDSDLGYIQSNVIVVSYKANSMKRNGTLKELEKIVLFYQKLSTGGIYA